MVYSERGTITITFNMDFKAKGQCDYVAVQSYAEDCINCVANCVIVVRWLQLNRWLLDLKAKCGVDKIGGADAMSHDTLNNHKVQKTQN
jgi:hypothetical protein